MLFAATGSKIFIVTDARYGQTPALVYDAETAGPGIFLPTAGPNRRPPVPVYRTGWTGYRLKPVKLKFEFKTHSYTGFEHLTGRLDRFTGPV